MFLKLKKWKLVCTSVLVYKSRFSPYVHFSKRKEVGNQRLFILSYEIVYWALRAHLSPVRPRTIRVPQFVKKLRITAMTFVLILQEIYVHIDEHTDSTFGAQSNLIMNFCQSKNWRSIKNNL